MGDLKPTAVDENNNNSVERVNTILEPNNILGAHILEKGSMILPMGQQLNNDSYTPIKRI